MAVNATLFREYARGRQPRDWYHLFDVEEAWPIRSVDGDSHRRSWLAPLNVAQRAVFAWSTADGETTGRANQEALGLFLVPAGDFDVLAVRASGAAGAEKAWTVALFEDGTLAIRKWNAGADGLTSTAALPAGFRPFSFWWVRLRANGSNNISAKAWLDGSAEPGAWTKTLVDASLADGAIGLIRNSAGIAAECLFFSYATNGDTAPGPEVIPAGMATWALDPDAQVELTVEIESLSDTDEEGDYFFSNRGRYTNARDFPSNAEMSPLLQDPGSLSIRLTEDLLFGQAGGSLGKVQLRNPRNTLNFFMDLTMAGRRLTVRAGLVGWENHRWFEPIYSSLMDGEPTVEENVDITLQAPYRQVEQKLQRRQCIGILTCLQLDGAGHEAVYNAAYDLTRFLLTFRLIADVVPVAHSPGISKNSGTTADDNFTIYLEPLTGEWVGRASIGGAPAAIFLRSEAGRSYADGAVHQVALGVDDDQLAYLAVDGEVVAQAVPAGLVDLAAAAFQLFGFAGERIFDIRLYNDCPEIPELQTILALRAAGDDPGIVGLWPCDDGILDVATDYSPTANHINLAGTIDVNFTWLPTDHGEIDQAGSQFQLVAGAAFNAPALLIDTNRQRFRLNDGALPGEVTMRSRGLVTGAWTDEGDGVVEFTSPSAEPITFDHGPTGAGDDAHLRLAAVTEALMTERMGLTEETYDPIATKSLLALLPYNAAFLAEDEQTGASALEVLLAGAAAHYRLDRDGRIVPGVVLPPITPGPVPDESVLEFLGTAGRSRVAWPSTTGDLPDGDFTLGFWVKSFMIDRWSVMGDEGEAFPSYGAIANNISADLGGYYVGFYRASQGAIGFRIPWLTGVYFVMPSGVIQWGIWTFVICRFNSATSTLTLWAGKLGGRLVKVYTTITTGTQFATAQSLELGGRLTAASQGSLYGGLAHYQVWDIALSDEGLQELMAAGGVPSLPNPNVTFYAPMNDGAGEQAIDLISGESGQIWGARWAPRLVIDLRAGYSRSRFKVKRLRPAWDAVVSWGRNLRPLTDADFATLVTAAERTRLKQRLRRQPAPAFDVKKRYLDAREITADSAIMEQPGARQTARNFRYRFDPARIQGAMTDAPRATLALGMGDEIWVGHPRISRSQLAALRVVGIAPSLKTLRALLDLWGNQLPGNLPVRVTDEGEPRITDEGDERRTD